MGTECTVQGNCVGGTARWWRTVWETEAVLLLSEGIHMVKKPQKTYIYTIVSWSFCPSSPQMMISDAGRLCLHWTKLTWSGQAQFLFI